MITLATILIAVTVLISTLRATRPISRPSPKPPKTPYRSPGTIEPTPCARIDSPEERLASAKMEAERSAEEYLRAVDQARVHCKRARVQYLQAIEEALHDGDALPKERK